MSGLLQRAVDTDEILEQAVLLRSSREGVSPSELVTGIVRKALAAEIDELSGALPLAELIRKVVRAQGRAGKSSGTAL
jgi:hypothetical protein